MGINEGSRLAHITIPSGETAILQDMIQGERPGSGFDLAGMGIGVVNPKRVIDGSGMEENDVIVGIESSGLHSNGYTMARGIIKTAKLDLGKRYDDLDRTLGEELLTPTHIYVDEILGMIKAGIHVKMVANITSDGFANLLRVGGHFGYEITDMPEPQSIFQLIQKWGPVSDAEMYQTFNMGVGMIAVVSREELDTALQTINRFGKKGFFMGNVKRDPERKVDLKPVNLMASGKDQTFYKY